MERHIVQVWHGVTAGLKDDGAPPFSLAEQAASHLPGAGWPPEKIVTPIAADAVAYAILDPVGRSPCPRKGLFAF